MTLLQIAYLSTISTANPVCDATRQMFKNTGCCGAGGDISVCVSPHVDLGGTRPLYAQALFESLSDSERDAVARLAGKTFRTYYPPYKWDVYKGRTNDAMTVGGSAIWQALAFSDLTASTTNFTINYANRSVLAFNNDFGVGLFRPGHLHNNDYFVSWAALPSRDAFDTSTMIPLRAPQGRFDIVVHRDNVNATNTILNGSTLFPDALLKMSAANKTAAVCSGWSQELIFDGQIGDDTKKLSVDCGTNDNVLFSKVENDEAFYTHLATFASDTEMSQTHPNLVRLSVRLYTATKGVFVSKKSDSHDDLVTVWTALIRTGVIDAWHVAHNRLLENGLLAKIDNDLSGYPDVIEIKRGGAHITPPFMLYEGLPIEPVSYVLNDGIVFVA